MKRILASTDTVLLEYLRASLRDRGIAAFVRNAVNAGSAAGELSPAVAPPELWVVDESDHDAAERLVERLVAAVRAPVAGEPWQCPRCGERIEPQFSQCWACGATHPDAEERR